MVTMTKEEKATLDYMNSTVYFIVHPRGDKSKVSVAENQRNCFYKYDLASDKEFTNKEDAIEYAKRLEVVYEK